MNNYFSSYTEDEILKLLPKSLYNTVMVLSTQGVEIDLISEHLSQNPSSGLIAKGSNKWDSSIYKKIKEELRIILLTDDPRYEELRSKINKEGSTSVYTIIALISGFVGKHLGVSASICVPFVVLIIVAFIKAGVVAVLTNDSDTE